MANQLITSIAKYRSRLDKQSQSDLTRLINAYGLMSQRLKDKVDLFLMDLDRNPTTNVQKTARYKDLTAALVDEYQRYTVYLETELQGIVAKAESQARLDSAALIAAALLGRGMQVKTSSIPTSRVNTNVLAPGSVAYKRLYELAPMQAQRIINNLLDGINKGYGFEKLAQMIVNDLGLGLADSLRWARTMQMEAYRTTSHDTMTENSNIIDGWTWWAQVDERTCDGCSEGHGTFHDASESLNDITPHIWNCRCVELPHVIGDDNPVTGEPIE